MKELKIITDPPSPPYDPWAALASAIIRQAVNDYRWHGKKLLSTNNLEEQKFHSEEMKKISRFFLGDYYSALSCNDNGGEILAVLDEEVFGTDERS